MGSHDLDTADEANCKAGANMNRLDSIVYCVKVHTEESCMYIKNSRRTVSIAARMRD